MKKVLISLCILSMLTSCGDKNTPDNLSVKGHTYFAKFQSTINDDTTFEATATIKFTEEDCYLNDEFAGKYTQTKETVFVHKVENYTGTQILISTDRVYTSYGDYITFNGVVYNKIE